MFSISYRMECKDLVDGYEELYRAVRKVHFRFAIAGLLIGIGIILAGAFKVLQPEVFLIVMGIIIIVLSISVLVTVYLRLPSVVYKRIKKKQPHLLDGVSYDLTIENGQVTLHEKNSKAEQTTTLKVEEYQTILINKKYYYFCLNKKVNSLHIFMPKAILSLEQIDELTNIFSGKFKYFDLKNK